MLVPTQVLGLLALGLMVLTARAIQADRTRDTNAYVHIIVGIGLIVGSFELVSLILTTFESMHDIDRTLIDTGRSLLQGAGWAAVAVVTAITTLHFVEKRVTIRG
jgi:Na+/phosphate symporter